MSGRLQPGERWRERDSGRVIVILATEVHGTGPSWHYEDEPVPTTRTSWSWHYCDVCDFALWDRFEYLPTLRLVP